MGRRGQVFSWVLLGATLGAVVGASPGVAEMPPQHAGPGDERRATGPALPASEFPSARAKDAPPGVLTSILSLRPPEAISCAARGDVIGVVDVASSDDDPPLIGGGGNRTPQLKLWRLAPTAGPHPANALVNRYRPVDSIVLSADGRFAGLRRNRSGAAAARHDVLIDLRANREIPTKALLAELGKGEELSVGSFSSNGKFALFTRQSGKDDAIVENGSLLFDLGTAKAVALPGDLRRTQWVSEDGLLLGAESMKGVAGVFDRSGKKWFPREGDRPLASAHSITMSADGKRLAVMTKGGTPPVHAVIVFAMPGWTELRTIPLGDAEKTLTQISLSGDGRILSTQRIEGEAEDAQPKVAFYETASGTRIGEPERLTGGGALPCAEGGRWLWHSGLLPAPKGGKNDRAYFRTDVVDPVSLMAAAAEGAPTDAKKIATALVGRDAAPAWQALAALRKAGATKAAVQATIATLPPAGLTEQDREKLKTLTARLGGDTQAVRDAATSEAEALFTRLPVGEFRTEVLPRLNAAIAGSDAEARRRAQALLKIWSSPASGRADGDTVASRLGLLR